LCFTGEQSPNILLKGERVIELSIIEVLERQFVLFFIYFYASLFPNLVLL
jgi:hypothetical protein